MGQERPGAAWQCRVEAGEGVGLGGMTTYSPSVLLISVRFTLRSAWYAISYRSLLLFIERAWAPSSRKSAVGREVLCRRRRRLPFLVGAKRNNERPALISPLLLSHLFIVPEGKLLLAGPNRS
jgi:hypothetical protein